MRRLAFNMLQRITAAKAEEDAGGLKGLEGASGESGREPGGNRE